MFGIFATNRCVSEDGEFENVIRRMGAFNGYCFHHTRALNIPTSEE